MVNEQPEALRLAELLDTCLQLSAVHHTDAAAELRRLHAENEAQRKELRAYMSTIDQFHHAVADAGWHPGRTDDLLTDIIREKGKEMRQLENEIAELRKNLKRDNASLMAAAPELLEALELFPGFTDDATIGDSWLCKVRSTIAKTGGAA